MKEVRSPRWILLAVPALVALLFMTLPRPSALAQASDQCTPACHSGFTCFQGRCISLCNPPCSPGQRCNDVGECVHDPGSMPGPGPSFTSTSRRWNVNLKAGVLTAGEVYIEEADTTIDTEAGFLGQVDLDAYVAPMLSLGVFVLIATTEESESGEEGTVTTIGGTLKGRFGGDRFEIRPGVAFGYQQIDVDVSGVKDTKGFDVAAVLEFAYYTSKKMAIVGELSFISQPAGGNDDSDVTFAPIMYFAGGVEFGG